jgi:prevent-host-death family protein
MVMKTVPAGIFKARCLRLMEEVRESREPVLVTKRGKPIAKLVPVDEAERPRVFGAMRGKIEIRGDVVAPVLPPATWKAHR